MFGGGTGGTYQSIGFANATDAVYLPAFAGGDGSLHLTEGFGFRGAFNHNWDPYWSTSLFGGYAAVRYDGTAKAQLSVRPTLRATPAPSLADFSCNPDFNLSQIGVVTRWTPVKNLTFSAEVLYFHLDQKFTGCHDPDAVGSQADRRLQLQGPGYRQLERSRSA